MFKNINKESNLSIKNHSAKKHFTKKIYKLTIQT